MGGSPVARKQPVVVGAAGQQLVQHVLDVDPDIQVVAQRTAGQRAGMLEPARISISSTRYPASFASLAPETTAIPPTGKPVR